MAINVTEEDAFLLRPSTPSAAVHHLAARDGWCLVTHGPRTRASGARHEWKVGDGSVNLVEDHESGHRIVSVCNSPALREQLAAQLPLLDEQTVLDQTRTTDDPTTRIRLLRVLKYLQLGAALRAGRTAPADPEDPEYKKIDDDVRYLDLFASALADPEPGIRRAAIDALGRSLFPGARAILRDHRDRLPDHTEVIDFYLEQPPVRISAAGVKPEPET
jgi:hypothetical protein